MPDAKNNAKQTGDTHLPEVESEQPVQEGMTDAVGADGTPQDRGRSTESGEEGKPGRGINQAGFIKDKDAPTSDSYGNTRDSGETSGKDRG
jgi:hypothetical protein